MYVLSRSNAVDPANISTLLQSSLSSSFSLPVAQPKPRPEPALDQVITPSTDLETAEEELEDWKPEYEARLSAWQAEAAEAREKAEKTRKRIEDERAAEVKAVKDKERETKKEKEDREKRERDEERLKIELGLETPGNGLGIGGRGSEGGGGGGNKVREAGELVGDSRDVVTDGRGATSGDIQSSKKQPIREVSHFQFSY